MVTVQHHPFHFFFLYIDSMRWVTRKPPKMLTEAKASATNPSARAQIGPLSSATSWTPTASSAPTTITEEIAFVTETADVVLAQLDIIAAAIGGAAQAATGDAIDPFVFRFSIFVLAIFVGYFVVWSVTPALHTPLMSVTNAISSVIVVGALLAVGVPLVANDSGPIWARVLGFIALAFASVNIFGGFLVTQRMLGMYQKKKK